MNRACHGCKAHQPSINTVTKQRVLSSVCVWVCGCGGGGVGVGVDVWVWVGGEGGYRAEGCMKRVPKRCRSCGTLRRGEDRLEQVERIDRVARVHSILDPVDQRAERDQQIQHGVVPAREHSHNHSASSLESTSQCIEFDNDIVFENEPCGSNNSMDGDRDDENARQHLM